MENINITVLLGIVILVVVSSSLFLINYFDRKSELIKSYFNNGEDLYFNDGDTVRIINKYNGWEILNENFKRGNESVKILHTREWK